MNTDRAHALARLRRDPAWCTRTAPAAPLVEVRHHVATFGLDVRFGNGAQIDGTFAGWGSVHNVVDSYGTRMLPGAWTAGGLDDEPYALLWMHDPNVVLGTFTAREEERGLWIEGRYDATDVGQRARAQAQSGSAPGLSVGFVVVSALADDPDAFNAVRLVEVSQITRRMAATPGAQMEQVRLANPRGLQRRARGLMPGSYEERQSAVADAWGTWAVAQYGPPAEDNDYYAFAEATFADRFVGTVARWTPERSLESWSVPYAIGDDGVVTLGDPTPVDVVTTVEPRKRAALARARLLLADTPRR